MNQLLEAHCKGTFRSYKTFRSSGQVILHTIQNFQEWDFNDNHVLIITQFQYPRKKLVCDTDQWMFEFQNKQHFIKIAQPSIRYEMITVNHTGMVLADGDRREKVFFARFAVWENLIRRSLPVF